MTWLPAIEAALEALAGGGAPRPLRGLASFACQVISMRSDGTADLATDDAAIGGNGGLVKRVLLAGLPGVRLDPIEGFRARLGFEGGKKSAPELVGYEQDRAADRPAGRYGDKVDIGTLTWATVPPAPPAPPSITLTLSLNGSPIRGSKPTAQSPIVLTLLGVAVPSAGSVILEGWITTGSPEISFRKAPTETIP